MNAEALQLNYLPSSLGFTNCIFTLDFLCLKKNRYVIYRLRVGPYSEKL